MLCHGSLTCRRPRAMPSSTQGHAEIDERATPAADAEKHRLTSSRQTGKPSTTPPRRAALPRASCSNPVSSAAATQDRYGNLCYFSQGTCHKTRRLTVAIGARATGDGRAGQERLLWRRWKLVAHPSRWPPADLDWGPTQMTLMPTGLGPLTEPSAAARLSVLPINDIQPSPSTLLPRPLRCTQLCKTRTPSIRDAWHDIRQT